MIKLLRFRPRRIIKQAPVTNLAQLRSLQPGYIEATLVRSRTNPRGIIFYDEIVRLVWPLNALFEASAEFQALKPKLMQQELMN